MGGPSVDQGRFKDLTDGATRGVQGRKRAGETEDPTHGFSNLLATRGSKITSWRTRKMKLSIKGRQRGRERGISCGLPSALQKPNQARLPSG